MKPRRIETASEEETIHFGQSFAADLHPPATLLLIGSLGAGKTTLAKGIVTGLGVALPDDVTSPTFTLIHDYGSRVFHLDLYRLETDAQIATLGLADLYDHDSILLVEWGERFPHLWPPDRIDIEITGSGDSRVICVRPNIYNRS